MDFLPIFKTHYIHNTPLKIHNLKILLTKHLERELKVNTSRLFHTKSKSTKDQLCSSYISNSIIILSTLNGFTYLFEYSQEYSPIIAKKTINSIHKMNIVHSIIKTIMFVPCTTLVSTYTAQIHIFEKFSMRQ